MQTKFLVVYATAWWMATICVLLVLLDVFRVPMLVASDVQFQKMMVVATIARVVVLYEQVGQVVRHWVTSPSYFCNKSYPLIFTYRKEPHVEHVATVG